MDTQKEELNVNYMELKTIETADGYLTSYGLLDSAGKVLWGWWNINRKVNELYKG